MKIDFSKPYSKYADVLRYITEESRNALLERAEQMQPMYEMTLADFFACCNGDFSKVVADMDNPTTGEVLWIECFKQFLEDFSKIAQRFVIPQTAEQKQASANCLPVEWQEGMLVFVRKYFGLKSFADAENITIADWILAKKDEYNAAIFERNMQNIQKQKIRR